MVEAKYFFVDSKNLKIFPGTSSNTRELLRQEIEVNVFELPEPIVVRRSSKFPLSASKDTMDRIEQESIKLLKIVMKYLRERFIEDAIIGFIIRTNEITLEIGVEVAAFDRGFLTNDQNS